MNSRDVTPDRAKAELERRDAARKEIAKRMSNSGTFSNVGKIPGYALGEAMQLPEQIGSLLSQAPGAAEKMLSHPIQSGQDVLGGVARGSQHLAATLGEAGQGIASLLTGGYAPRINMQEFMGLGQQNPVDLGAMIESQNPNKLLSTAGQYMGAGALGKGILPISAASGLTAAAQAAPGERTKAATEGAVGALLPMTAGKAAKGAYNLRPSKLFESELSPEELQANLEAAQGTNTGLGDVIESPTLKRFYENVLPHVYFSGATKKMMETANQLQNKGENLLGNLGSGLPEGNLNQHLQEALQSASASARAQKNANYRKVNDIAEKENVSIGRENLQAKAKEAIDKIQKSPELEREIDPSLYEDLHYYAKNPQGNSLELSNILKGKLNDKASDYYSANKSYEYGIMRDLRD